MTNEVNEIDDIFGVIDLWASDAVRKKSNMDGADVYNPYNAKELAVRLYNAGYRDVSMYKAEIERLKSDKQELETALKQSEDNYSRAFERLKLRQKQISEQEDLLILHCSNKEVEK